MASLKDKVAIVTGASSGIGAAIAREFAKYGAKMTISGRILENLESTAKDCRELGLPDSHLFLVTGDVTDEEFCKNLIEKTIAHYGRLDVLINVAGAVKTMCFWNCSSKAFDEHMAVNVNSVFYMCKYAMPHLYESKGVCINMGSLSGLRPYNTLFPYSVTKGCLDHMTRALSLEAGPKGCRVLTVNPGSISDTNVWERSGICPTPERKKAHEEKSWPLYPLLRIGKAVEVARVVAWLASDDASFIHGVNFPIDGGMSCMSQHMM